MVDGRNKYYEGLGLVVLRLHGPGYLMRLKQPTNSSNPPVLDLKPWAVEVSSIATTKRIFNIETNGRFPYRPADFLPTGFLENELSVFSELLSQLSPLLIGDAEDNVQSTLEEAKRLTRNWLREYQRVSDIDVEESRELVGVYKEMEKGFYSSVVAVPVLGLEVSSSRALLAIAGLVLVLSIIIRSRLDTVVQSGATALGEPWLLLEASSNMAKWLAKAWLVMFVSAPAIVWISDGVVFVGALIGGDTVGTMSWMREGISCAFVAVSSTNTVRAMKALGVLSARLSEVVGEREELDVV